MDKQDLIVLMVAALAIIPMVALPETSVSSAKSSSGEIAKPTTSDSAVKAPDGNVRKPHEKKSSAFRKEFMTWADKQDWFALSKTAEFGDLNRERCAEKGMTFGYSVEFVDSKGKKHIIGVGLAKEPKMAEKKEMKSNMAEMSAQKNLMMHGKTASADAAGRQSRTVVGTINATQVLSKTIVRPGTEEKWMLRVYEGQGAGT